MRWLPVAVCIAQSMIAVPALATLPKDTPVRIRAAGLDAGWSEGKIGVSAAGCTMVYLKTKTKAGYTSVALVAVEQMERQQGGAWVAEPLKPHVAQESKACRDAAND